MKHCNNCGQFTDGNSEYYEDCDEDNPECTLCGAEKPQGKMACRECDPQAYEDDGDDEDEDDDED